MSLARIVIGTLLLLMGFSARAQSFHFWPAEGNGADLLGGVTAVPTNYVGEPAFSAGFNGGQAFSLNASGQGCVTSGPNPVTERCQYVDFGNQFGNPGTSSFVISFVFRTSQPASQLATLLSKRNSCGNGSFWNLRLSGGAVVAELDDGGVNYSALQSSTIVNDWAWHTVILARTGSAVQLVVDGNAVVDVKPVPANIDNAARVLAGATDTQCGYDTAVSFDGNIDNVQYTAGQ